MLSKKMLSLLTAAAVSGGGITAAAIVPPTVGAETTSQPAAEASGQTMAEIYEPYYEPTTATISVMGSWAPLRSSRSLPAGTQFFLAEGGDHGVKDGIYYSLSNTADGNMYFTEWVGYPSTPIPAAGTTVNIPVTVIYPDNSAEDITAVVTLVPQQAESYEVSYPAPSLVEGTTAVFTPMRTDLPAETSVVVTATAAVTTLRNDGWVIETSENGVLHISAPVGAVGSVKIPLLVSYPDGTSETTTVTVTVTPKPTMADEHELVYSNMNINAGTTATVTPDQGNLPEGTQIALANTNLSDGWTIDVNAEGEVIITTADDTHGTQQIPLTVTYPDGTSETAIVTVTVTPKLDDSNEPRDEGDAGDPGESEGPTPTDPELSDPRPIDDGPSRGGSSSSSLSSR